MVIRDRRRAARRHPHPSEPVSRVRIRAGRELVVVNVSSTGVLVEGEARLLPGTQLELHVVANGGRTLVRSRVARAYVAALSGDRVLYRGALAFDRSLDLAPVPSDVERPALKEVERPAWGKVEGLALSKVEGPALSKVEGNALPAACRKVPRRMGTGYPLEWGVAVNAVTPQEN